jgi:hypothetical protein
MLPTPAQWAARLENFQDLVEQSVAVEELRERVRIIEGSARASPQAARRH